MSRIAPTPHSREGPVDCVPEIWGVMTWLSSVYMIVTHVWCAFSIIRRTIMRGIAHPWLKATVS